MNIYKKQMQSLGLNPKQYAELINIPYDVVKNFIYEKEGDYEMGLKELLRRNMLDKHQAIEENFESAKIKATEIKYKTNTNARKWYEEEYTPDLLCYKLNIKTRAEFERNYDILIDGKRASKWFYVNVTGKRNYDNHEISENVLNQFVEQLYDIIVNGNGDKYKRETPTEVKQFPTQRKPLKSKNYKNKYFEWFRDFDIKAYLKQNDMTYRNLADELGIGIYTIHQLANKQHYTKRTLQKLYNFVKENETPALENQEEEYWLTSENTAENEETNANNTTLDNLANELEDNSPAKIVVEEDSNALLRKILASRLTDEEKELIRIFGGNI